MKIEILEDFKEKELKIEKGAIAEVYNDMVSFESTDKVKFPKTSNVMLPVF